MFKPLVSIIIPTYNEEENILECLLSLSKQSYRNLEFVVVDDGSTDTTLDKLLKLPGITLLQQVHKGAGAARNLGLSKAKGDIFVFVDADMTFAPDFIEKLIEPITEGKTIGTFTKEELVGNIKNPTAYSWSIIRGFAPGKMHRDDYPDHQPVFRAIKASEFKRVNGFDTTTGYDDDWSLSKKLGVEATVAPGAKIYHNNPSSLKKVFTQAKWMATRQYKFGLLGKIITLFKIICLINFVKDIYLAVKNKSATVLITGIVFDLGLLVGLFSNKKGK
jgi:glycosyltransferase involved in cell wall biosynthesis